MSGTEAQTAFRLSPQQQRQLARESMPEVVQCAAMLDGPVDAERIAEALRDLVRRHEILRTTFVKPAGMRLPQQVIGEHAERSFSLRVQSSAERAIHDPAALEELLASEAEREHDLACDPPVRALLAGADEQRTLLLLTLTGACADADSSLSLLRELCTRLRNEQADRQEPIQYADYAEWRNELIAGQEPQTKEGLAYWREDAAARPTRSRILFAPLTGTSGLRPACVSLDLDAIGVEDLHRAAVGAGATAPVFLEAVWHTLLARVSGASELLVAGWCDGRAQPDLAEAIGPYEQPAPIHSRFQEATTFAEILDQVRRSRARAVRYQDYAGAEELTQLVDQATAGWAFHAAGQLAAPVRALLALRMPTGGTHPTLSLRAGGGRLAGDLFHDPVAFPAQDARELASRFTTLLRGALANPSLPVTRLPIVERSERTQLLSACAGSAISPAPKLVHELLEQQARSTPDRLAVVDASGSLTYAELDAAANRLANHLELLGPVRRQTVGLCMERTPAMIVALMAILKAGGAYLPLNHEHPKARIAHQLGDAGVQTLITEEHLLDSLPPVDGAVICTDRDAKAIAGQDSGATAQRSPGALRQVTSADDLVYVMHTSGSSGKPKGVAVTHRNLANYAASIVARLSQGGEDLAGLTFGLVSAISTDLGNTSIFAPLACGGCIRLIGPEASMDGDLLASELAGNRLDVLKIAPSHLQALLAADNDAALPRRWLIVGGEALSWELVEQVRSLSGGCRIINHYGPTETTVGCLAHEVEQRRRTDAATVPIGYPLAGVRAYVLDRQLEPLPAGVPGELCVAGAGVAAGYLRAGEESERFVADPFAPESDAGRMYRTGDRVRLLRDGAIEFLGRVDDQVKIRGFRVQPGEVEAALLSHRAIRQAAVCAEQDQAGALRLVAYVVSPEQPAVEELRAFLREALPDHMIPSAFRTAEALPLTASGKVDRSALASLAELQARREAEYVAPRDEVEEQIAKIWSELLRVERVGALDDFFALGGHSLLATQATMRIRKLYGDISLRALLAAPTVAALADVVRTNGERAATGAGSTPEAGAAAP